MNSGLHTIQAVNRWDNSSIFNYVQPTTPSEDMQTIAIGYDEIWLGGRSKNVEMTKECGGYGKSKHYGFPHDRSSEAIE